MSACETQSFCGLVAVRVLLSAAALLGGVAGSLGTAKVTTNRSLPAFIPRAWSIACFLRLQRTLHQCWRRWNIRTTDAPCPASATPEFGSGGRSCCVCSVHVWFDRIKEHGRNHGAAILKDTIYKQAFDELSSRADPGSIQCCSASLPCATVLIVACSDA